MVLGWVRLSTTDLTLVLGLWSGTGGADVRGEANVLYRADTELSYCKILGISGGGRACDDIPVSFATDERTSVTTRVTLSRSLECHVPQRGRETPPY